MIKKTTHYELSKPDYNETADIEVINSNMDIIDGALHELKSDLDGLGYGENGAYNLLDLSKLLNSDFDIEEGNITNKITDTRTIFNFYVHLLDKDGKIINEVVKTNISSNESKDFTFSIPSGCEKINLKHNGSSTDIIIGMINIVDIGLKENDTITVHISISSSNPTVVGGIVIKELAIVKGDTFIGYKPYIPSVKMLAEEVNAQNESLSNKTKLTFELGDIKWVDGSNLDSTTWKRSGFIKVTPNTKYTVNRTKTENMNIVGYKEDKSVITDGFNPSSAIVQSCKTAEYEFTTTPTTNYIRIAISDTNLSENITLTNNGIGNTVVELVEDVDELKNDLGGLSLSASGTTLTITDGTNTWTLEAN